MVDPDKQKQRNQLTSIDRLMALDRDVIEDLVCLRTCLAMQSHQQSQQAELEKLTNRQTSEALLA
jgi:hypothetical protein